MKQENKKLYDLEAEAALLGLFIIHPIFFIDKRIYLESKNFYDKKNQVIYEAMVLIVENNQNIDPLLLSQKVVEINTSLFIDRNDVLNYISYLSSTATIEANGEIYIKIIVNFWQKREFEYQINLIKKEISESNFDFNEKVEKVNKIANFVQDNKNKDFQPFTQILDNSINTINKLRDGHTITGLPTGWPSLDKLLLGLNNGDLCILAGRPSMGKSAFMVNLAVNVAKYKKTIAIFSLEMPSVQLANRILSSQSYISLSKIRDPQKLTINEYKNLQITKENIKSWKIFVDDTASINISNLVWKAKRLKQLNNLDLIIIDYLQLVQTSEKNNFENRQREISVISSKLKQLARELEIPIIALSQLSRRVEQREDKIPIMSDLRESGSLEQDADQVIFLYRENYYNKEIENPSEPHLAKVIIAKHRNGAIGEVELLFDPSKSLFTTNMSSLDN
ncbi:MAG: replicative DNA helicase [Mycoplasma sp.]|nr:replicative DNA helicase [Mycoplasma sp.]